ncbi:hypothetical protein BDF14DRAFT_1861718 [Spinellus fusiger]|nr:hypothetical protein BDF14DRAFT_1861718 [Spinellus fusiger]
MQPMQTLQAIPVQPLQAIPVQPLQAIPPPMMNNSASFAAPCDNGVDMAKEQQKALLMQVLQLTEDQINVLPPEHRDQIRLLKAQLEMQQPR